MRLSVRVAARGVVEGPKVEERLMNMVEMACGAYDPYLACATHCLPGHVPLTVNLETKAGRFLESSQETGPAVHQAKKKPLRE